MDDISWKFQDNDYFDSAHDSIDVVMAGHTDTDFVSQEGGWFSGDSWCDQAAFCGQ